MSLAHKKVFFTKPLLRSAHELLEETGCQVVVWDSNELLKDEDLEGRVNGCHVFVYCASRNLTTKKIIDIAGINFLKVDLLHRISKMYWMKKMSKHVKINDLHIPVYDKYKLRKFHLGCNNSVLSQSIKDNIGPQLEAIITVSVGVDQFDLDELRRRGIRLGHVAGHFCSEGVAEVALLLMLTVSRDLLGQMTKLENNEINWTKKWNFDFGDRGLLGSTVGIIGLGEIGMGVARRVRSFGASKILYTSRSEKPKNASEVNAVRVTFEDLLRESDFVVICCTLNETSRGMFNKEAFEKMKKSSVLVNVARGAIVDHDDLLHALKENIIRGAGLDVTYPEPLPPNHPLFKLPNCVVLPHIGTSDVESKKGLSDCSVMNVLAVLKGEPMISEYPL